MRFPMIRAHLVTLGLRVGTPAITTRGLVLRRHAIGYWMCDILDAVAEDGNAQQVIAEVKEKVLDICQRYPVYQ